MAAGKDSDPESHHTARIWTIVAKISNLAAAHGRAEASLLSISVHNYDATLTVNLKPIKHYSLIPFHCSLVGSACVYLHRNANPTVFGVIYIK